MAQKYRTPACIYSAFTALLFTTLILLAAPLVAHAEEINYSEWLPEATTSIKNLEAKIKNTRPDRANIETLANDIKVLNQIRSNAQQCITDTDAQLLKVTEDLATLGEPVARESPEVIKKRSSLTAQQKALDKQLSSCKLLQLQSQDLIKSINQLQQSKLAQQLSARSPDIITVVAQNLKAPAVAWQDSIDFLRAQYQSKSLSPEQLLALILLAGGSVLMGAFLKRKLGTITPAPTQTEDSVYAFGHAVRTSLARALPFLLPVATTAAFLSIALPLSPLPFLTKTSYILGIYFSLIVLINILLSPAPPAQTYLTHPDELSRRFARKLKVLLTLIAIGFFLFTGEFRAGMSEAVYYLNRGIYSIILIINLISLLWMVRLFSWSILSRRSRLFLSLILSASLIAELAGYRNLSFFVVSGLIATSLSLGLTLLIHRLIKDLCDGLDEGRLSWQKNLRRRAELKEGSQFPGLIWVRIIIFTVLWGGFVLLALNIWRLTDPWLAVITTYLTDGFQVGSLTITPTLLAGGILAYAVVLNLTRYIKVQMLPYGLKYTSLDRGAREAVASLIGYLGVGVAILIALSVAGVQMQNIAIIAGALSVGIGFGLQNIVNNFVSGLILLFERPVRRGDWIITGDTEGYVKAINIRSTQIETFDRADVIVPNSELITSKVTNWMLRDPYGRVTIPVGVGYGSDVEKVRDVLLEIANNHPLVMKDHPQLAEPKVLFRSFGDNSLNFELRFFIHNIDEKLNVTSDFNFAIVEAFRRDDIEIPFPQRVITVANWKNPEEAGEKKDLRNMHNEDDTKDSKEQ